MRRKHEFVKRLETSMRGAGNWYALDVVMHRGKLWLREKFTNIKLEYRHDVTQDYSTFCTIDQIETRTRWLGWYEASCFHFQQPNVMAWPRKVPPAVKQVTWKQADPLTWTTVAYKTKKKPSYRTTEVPPKYVDFLKFCIETEIEKILLKD